MSNIVFVPNTDAYKDLKNNLVYDPTSKNLLQLAMSLGAVIAGGSAISALKKIYDLPSPRFISDVDIWFSDEEMLQVFLASLKLPPYVDEVRIRRSFGGSAYDIIPKSSRGKNLQVIVFKTGNVEKIISDFDFVNCAVAVNETGVWHNKDVPQLLRENRLEMQNGSSPYLLSRVEKYRSKGFTLFGKTLKKRLFQNLNSLADDAINHCSIINIREGKDLENLDKEYKPMMKKMTSIDFFLRKFVTENEEEKDFLDSDDKKILEEKKEKIRQLIVSTKTERTTQYNLPYGYENFVSSPKDENAFLSMLDDI